MDRLREVVLYILGLNQTQRCRYCNELNYADDAVCKNCKKVILRTFLLESTISMVCCCLVAPAAIGCAIRAHIELWRGNYDVAEECAEWAKKLYWATLALGALVYLVVGLLVIYAIGALS